MEERTREMKLKMNKYKQGAGSDSRLEQDYHKVRRRKGRSILSDTCYMCFSRFRGCSTCAYSEPSARHMVPVLHPAKRARTHLSTACALMSAYSAQRESDAAKARDL